MKQFSYKIQNLREAEKKIEISDLPMIQLLRRELGKIGDWEPNPEPILSSKEFRDYWQYHVEQIALFKEDSKTKKRTYRNMEYASIGIMDKNDVIQEAYLCFMHAWYNVDWKKINEVSDDQDREKMLWGFLKNSTVLRLSRHLRENKDGMKITDHSIFEKQKGTKIKGITSLFSRLDKVLFDHEASMSLTKYENDLIGDILEEVMDDVLDKKPDGTPKKGGIEKFVLMNFLGIDGHMTYKEMANYFGVSEKSLRNVKNRALTKLRSDESKRRIATFIQQYKIDTNADI